MARYLKWHMCPCHEPLVTQVYICSNTFGRQSIYREIRSGRELYSNIKRPGYFVNDNLRNWERRPLSALEFTFSAFTERIISLMDTVNIPMVSIAILGIYN